MNAQFSNTLALALATAAASLTAAAHAADAPKGSSGLAVGANDKVHCYNVHSCKGQSDCATAEHKCKGHNSCKGHGFQSKTAKDCLVEGGIIGDLKAAK